MGEKAKALFEKFNQRSVRAGAVCLVLIVVLAVSVGAMLAAGLYVLPQADDYGFSAETHAVWASTHSLSKTIVTAAYYARTMYLYWQGSYSACFLMALQPGLFGNGVYRITAPLLLGSFLLATWLAVRAVHRHLLPDAPRVQVAIAALAAVLLQLYFIPHPDQSWYWYNGSVYYTFFYSLTLALLALALAARDETRRTPRVLYAVCMAALGAFLGGGPFSIIMVALALLGLLCAQALRAKGGALLPLASGFVCLAIGFAANMFAPGNDVRATYFGETPGAVHSIYLAVVNAVNDVLRWTNLGIVVALVLLAPVLWRIARFARCTFRLPGLAVLLSFGLPAMMLCPPIYAMGNTGPGRLTNIVFFCYVWWLLFSEFYVLGWVQRRLPGATACADAVRGFCARFAPTLAACAAIFFTFIFTVGLYRENPAISAAAIVANGQARTFYGELAARIPIYEDPAISDVVVDSLTVMPYPIYHDDLSDDPTYFANADVALYYHKNTVRVRFPEA